jgi:predicted dehydrogenase
MKIAIIGTGVQALKRIEAIRQVGEDSIVFIASSNPERASLIAQKYNIPAHGSELDLLKRSDVEVVVVCGTTDKHFQSCIDGINHGRHILCEKPLTKTVLDAKDLILKANNKRVLLKCGFNHRHYPGIIFAKNLVDEFQYGKILSIRCNYGICGRENFHEEWRASPEKTMGGQLIEQGVHAIDLFLFFGLKIESLYCISSNLYFNTSPIEDNAFLIGKCKKNMIFSLNTSFTEWENNFEFHVNLEGGYVKVMGLGPSYGGHSVEYLKRDFRAPFNKNVITYNPTDLSFFNEWIEFKKEIIDIQNSTCVLNDDAPIKAMEVVENAYKSSKKSQSIKIC